MLYVNVYSVSRHYGGPEEGGWWFDAGKVVASHPSWSLDQARVLQDALRESYPPSQGAGRYSVFGGEDIVVTIEDEPARAWPETRPHYE